MTAGHLLFSIGMTSYTLIAVHVEERDLVAVLGDEYDEYRKKVSMLVPTCPDFCAERCTDSDPSKLACLPASASNVKIWPGGTLITRSTLSVFSLHRLP